MDLSLRLTNIAFDHLVNIWGLAAEFFHLSPLVFRVRITNKCNLQCHYCYVGESLNKKIENILTLEEWKKVITKLPQRTLIDITGGEPFLTPDFETILNIMLDRKLKVSLITNGTIHKEGLLKTIVEKQLSHFMISFDGNIEAHDSVRGKGSFDKAIKTAQKIIDYKKFFKSKYPLLVAKITLTEENHRDLDGLIDYLINQIGFSGITINLLFENSARNGFVDARSFSDEKFWNGNTKSFVSSEVSFMTASIKNIFNKYKKKIQMRPDIDLKVVEEYFKNPKLFFPKDCHKYRSIVTMYSDGTLSPCDLGLDVGNIREINYNVGSIVRKNKMKEFYKLFKSEQRSMPGCQGCCLKKHERTA